MCSVGWYCCHVLTLGRHVALSLLSAQRPNLKTGDRNSSQTHSNAHSQKDTTHTNTAKNYSIRLHPLATNILHNKKATTTKNNWDMLTTVCAIHINHIASAYFGYTIDGIASVTLNFEICSLARSHQVHTRSASDSVRLTVIQNHTNSLSFFHIHRC